MIPEQIIKFRDLLCRSFIMLVAWEAINKFEIKQDRLFYEKERDQISKLPSKNYIQILYH